MTTTEALEISMSVLREKIEPDRISLKFIQTKPDWIDSETKKIMARYDELSAALGKLQELKHQAENQHKF